MSNRSLTSGGAGPLYALPATRPAAGEFLRAGEGGIVRWEETPSALLPASAYVFRESPIYGSAEPAVQRGTGRFYIGRTPVTLEGFARERIDVLFLGAPVAGLGGASAELLIPVPDGLAGTVPMDIAFAAAIRPDAETAFQAVLAHCDTDDGVIRLEAPAGLDAGQLRGFQTYFLVTN